MSPVRPDDSTRRTEEQQPGAASTELDAWLQAHTDELIGVRRYLHQHPELSGEEFETTLYLRESLEHLGFGPRVFADGTGLVCDIRIGDPQGPPIALRADIDALPLQDEKDVPYRSRNDGCAHACGHDVHTAVVLGTGWAVRELLEAQGRSGHLRLIFQHAEERMPGGAREVIAEGGLDDVTTIFGFHCDPTLEVGRVGLRSGAITSAADRFRLVLTGPGGHTARPGETIDLVRVAADLVTELPGRVQAALGTPDATLVFGMLHAGDVANVIPTHAQLEGTLRTTDPGAWERALDIIPREIGALIEPTGAGHELDYVRGLPAVICSDGPTARVRRIATELYGPTAVVPAPQSFGADDFAWYLQEVPGTYVRLGTATPGARSGVDLHAGTFDVDESCIAFAVRLFATVAIDALT